MRYSTARMGRIFVIGLEDGEVLHATIERFAEEQGIRAAALIIVGGADEGGLRWWWGRKRAGPFR